MKENYSLKTSMVMEICKISGLTTEQQRSIGALWIGMGTEKDLETVARIFELIGSPRQAEKCRDFIRENGN